MLQYFLVPKTIAGFDLQVLYLKHWVQRVNVVSNFLFVKLSEKPKSEKLETSKEMFHFTIYDTKLKPVSVQIIELSKMWRKKTI